MRHSNLTPEIDKDRGEIVWTGKPGSRQMPRGAGRLEHLLHAQRRPDLDVSVGDLRSRVAKPVGATCSDRKRFAWTCVKRSPTDAEAHPSLQHGEPLLLLRMDVASRNVASRRKEEIEGKKAAAGLGAGLENDDVFTSGRVVDRATCPGHVQSATDLQF